VLTTDENDRDGESGEAIVCGERLSGKTAMERAGIPRIVLEAKEGLALNNGTAISTAITILAAADAHNLVEHAALAVSLTLEAIRGASNAFDARIHDAARHHGQKEIAARVRALTHGSRLVEKAQRVQDAYSIRCAPQVITRSSLSKTKTARHCQAGIFTAKQLRWQPRFWQSRLQKSVPSANGALFGCLTEN
jgi:histidine ammonia-lyase